MKKSFECFHVKIEKVTSKVRSKKKKDNALYAVKILSVLKYQIKIPFEENQLKVKPTKFRYLLETVGNLIE